MTRRRTANGIDLLGPESNQPTGAVMKLLTLVILLSSNLFALDPVYRFDSPTGVAIRSDEKHKPSPDGYSGVQPVVSIDGKRMKVVWGHSQSAGGGGMEWNAVIIHRNSNSISAVVVDSGDEDSSVMLFTLDLKRKVLYMSAHKNSDLLGGSSAASFVAKPLK